MNSKEQRNLAAEAADSIIGSFSKSVSRAVALFETPQEALGKLIMPEIENLCGITIDTVPYDEMKKNYSGEIRYIPSLLGIQGDFWESIIRRISAIAKEGHGKMFKHGDSFYISAYVPEKEIDGYKFAALELKDARLIVTISYEYQVVLNFENVIFHAPMNKEATNDGSFRATILAKYLNEHFLPSVFKNVESCLTPNSDGLKVSLPTYVEVFGNNNNRYTETNWGEKERHPYFEKCTNRIKVQEEDRDDTCWWWLSSPIAASSNSFCFVYTNGYAGNSNAASNMDGGIAPAICVS